MIKWSIWFIRVLWKLNKHDRASLRNAVTRWTNWEEDWDRRNNKVDVKSIHDVILNYVPMGAGYILLVSQSQATNWTAVDVEITFSSNLSNTQAVEILDKTQRTLMKER